MTEHSAAISEQLLASGGQEKAATDTVEKLEAAFVFEIADLPRQSGLADAQTQRRLETVPRSATATKVRRRFRSIMLISKMHKE